MRCLVTAGPTYEPLDKVRRLTNFSTGQLGTELALFLSGRGHDVTLMRGVMSTFPRPAEFEGVVDFTTSDDLSQQMESRAGSEVQAIFHVAAVGDFSFGPVYERQQDGSLVERVSGKYSTRSGPLLVELVPTPKILQKLRGWFPTAFLAGWKYEVEGDAIERGREQLLQTNIDVTVVNGPAYGAAFGILSAGGQPLQHCLNREDLCEGLDFSWQQSLRARAAKSSEA